MVDPFSSRVLVIPARSSRLMIQKQYSTSKSPTFDAAFLCLLSFMQLFSATWIASGLIPALVNVVNDGITRIPRILVQSLLASNYFLSSIETPAISLITSMLLRATAQIRQKCLGHSACPASFQLGSSKVWVAERESELQRMPIRVRSPVMAKYQIWSIGKHEDENRCDNNTQQTFVLSA